MIIIQRAHAHYAKAGNSMCLTAKKGVVYSRMAVQKVEQSLYQLNCIFISLHFLQPLSFTDENVNEGNKRMSVERIYQRKTQLEHILLRPDTYIGSTEETTQPMWVYDEDKKAIIQKQITFVPGLYKIFDEILGIAKH